MNYDAIIIGSGIGAQTLAVLMAKLKQMKVLVLEKHWTWGGMTHEFNRKARFSFDVGIHYIGGMAPGRQSRRIFDYITDGKLDWVPVPDPYDTFVYPDHRIGLTKDFKAFQAEMIRLFPQEEKGIRRYFTDLKKTGAQMGMNLVRPAMPAPLRAMMAVKDAFGKDLSLLTTREYLDKHINDEKCKAILVSQWGDYGLPPAESAFGMHCMVARHYAYGAWFPEGGASRIAECTKPIIEGAGGACLDRHEVTEVIIENGRAVGVKARTYQGRRPKELEFRAPLVISNASARMTYLNLIKDRSLVPFSNELNEMENGCSAVCLYIGLKESPEKIGVHGGNYWIYADYDHDGVADHSHKLLEGDPHMCYLSFPSMKNPHAEGNTAEMISFARYEDFEKWKDGEWRKRGEDYDALKQKITDGLIDLAERLHPGFRKLVDFSELSTPLSYEKFCAQDRGAFYGLPASPERFRKKWLGAKTPVPGLYMTGQDVTSVGLMGACMAGIRTFGEMKGGMNLVSTMSAIMRSTS